MAPGLQNIGGFVIAESAVETAISTETNDDLLAGRTLAAAVGEVAEYLSPGSGEQLARDLVEGKTAQSQVLITVAGFLQNLGINVAVGDILRAVERGGRKSMETGINVYHGTTKEAAEAIEAAGFKPSNTSVLGDTDGVYFTSREAYASGYAGEGLAAFGEEGADPGVILMGQLPDDLNILDLWSMNRSVIGYADAMNVKPSELTRWAREQGYDGIAFNPSLMDGMDPDEYFRDAPELFLFGTKNADRVVGSVLQTLLRKQLLRQPEVHDEVTSGSMT